MTYTADNHPPKTSVIGAYSLWPRRAKASRRRVAMLAGGAGALGVIAHCVVPMIIGA